MCCCSSEVAFRGVVVNCNVEASGSIQWLGLAVYFESFREGICSIIRFTQLACLNCCTLFEGLASLLICVIRRLDVVCRYGARKYVLCFDIRNAFAAWVYKSAAFCHFSSRPPNKLNPPPALAAAFSAFEMLAYWGMIGGVDSTFCRSARGSCAIFAEAPVFL